MGGFSQPTVTPAGAAHGPYSVPGSPAASRSLAGQTATATTSTAATNVTPFGYTTAAQADGVRAAANATVADVAALYATVKAMIADLQAYVLLS